jgi:protein kinase-like protein
LSERRLAPGVGETFGGYMIESVLGRGGMGAVYLATHTRLKRKVALKVISPKLALDQDFRIRFLRESQLAASLDHPNVIPIYDADEIEGVLYLAMRYVDGPSLQSRIRERGLLSLAETSRLADQMGGALDAAHRAGLVHRDVKPANVLLAEPDDHAYLCDFGLAKRTSSKELTQTGFFLGTVDYCAPEQIQGRPLDGRADVYAFGCVLFHCLTGQPPYVRETDVAVLAAHLHDPPPELASIRPDLPRSLAGSIVTAMAKDPDDRYPTAGDLAADFKKAVASGGGEATRVAPTIPTAAIRPRPAGRRGRLIAALVLLVALAGVALGLLAIRGPGSGSSDTSAKLRTFVIRVENVLEQAAAGRAEIRTALTGAFNCSISPQEAGRRIGSVSDNRQSILGQLGNLQTPTQQSDDVVTFLQRALQQSSEADRHYRDGFVSVTTTGCPLPSNSNFRLAAQSNARATAAKKRFVAEFNPLAERFHRRTWAAGDF